MNSSLPTETEGLWWCPECKSHVHGSHVTYFETHDERADGCGHKVTAEKSASLSSNGRVSDERLAQLLLLEQEILTQYVSPDHAADERDRIALFMELQQRRSSETSGSHEDSGLLMRAQVLICQRVGFDNRRVLDHGSVEHEIANGMRQWLVDFADGEAEGGPYLVRTFWSPDRQHLITAHVTKEGIVAIQDDNGKEWKPAGPQQDMSAVKTNDTQVVKADGADAYSTAGNDIGRNAGSKPALGPSEKAPEPIRAMIEANLRNGPASQDAALTKAMYPPPYIDGPSGKANDDL